MKKKCTKCKEVKYIVDFWKNRSKHDGFKDSCKACSKIAMREYREANRDKVRAYKKKWNAENPESHYASTKAWRRRKKVVNSHRSQLGEY